MIITRTDPAKLEAFRILRREGKTICEIARVMKVTERTAYRWLVELKRVKSEATKLMNADA